MRVEVDVVCEMPAPSTAMTRPFGQPRHEGRRTFVLDAAFEDTATSVAFDVTLRFSDVHAYRVTFLPSLERWQIEAAYDRLVVVRESAWLRSLRGSEGLRHYVLTCDDGPCFELAAREVAVQGVPPI